MGDVIKYRTGQIFKSERKLPEVVRAYVKQKWHFLLMVAILLILNLVVWWSIFQKDTQNIKRIEPRALAFIINAAFLSTVKALMNLQEKNNQTQGEVHQAAKGPGDEASAGRAASGRRYPVANRLRR